MRMYVSKTKIMAVLSVMAALSTVLTVLGTVISVNTVFFTSAAAFLVGIAVISYGMVYGTIFFFVCMALDFFVNPNKLHVVLYAALAGYILLSEGTYLLLARMKDGKGKEWLHRGIRFVIFEALYLPFLIFLPKLFVSDTMLAKPWFMLVMIPGGVVVWFLYELAYFVVKRMFREKFARILN